ncbi:OmpP1/FadL family transporter [Candidatus Neomarinimicrobiota bacterium]
MSPGILLAILLPVFCAGQTESDIVRPFWGVGGSSARATGLGGAFTGVADDQSALFYNPAGLGHMTEGEINSGIEHSNFDSELNSNIIGNGVGLSVTRLANLGMAMPVIGTKFTWAAGYNLVHSFERSKEYTGLHPYPLEDSAGVMPDLVETLDTRYEDGHIGSYSLGFGYQVSPKFAVGAALDFIVGNRSYTDNIDFEEENLVDFLITDTEYRAFDLSLGILLAPITDWRIGLLLRTPQNVTFKESANENNNEDKAEYSARGSFYFRLGTSYTTGPLLIAADISWYDYSQIKFESGFYDGDIPYDPVVNGTFRNDYEGVLGYAVGGEYLLPFANAKLRGGYRFTPHIRNDNGADGARAIAIGFSALLVPQLKIDMTYSRTDWSRSADENWLVSGLTVNLLLRL